MAAAISGTIVDPSGAGVGGAKVIVTNDDTGATRTAISDESGNFSVLSLAPGPFEVKVEKNGFKAAVRTGIHLQVAQQAVVWCWLEIGEYLQAVTVRILGGEYDHLGDLREGFRQALALSSVSVVPDRRCDWG